MGLGETIKLGRRSFTQKKKKKLIHRIRLFEDCLSRFVIPIDLLEKIGHCNLHRSNEICKQFLIIELKEAKNRLSIHRDTWLSSRECLAELSSFYCFAKYFNFTQNILDGVRCSAHARSLRSLNEAVPWTDSIFLMMWRNTLSTFLRMNLIWSKSKLFPVVWSSVSLTCQSNKKLL